MMERNNHSYRNNERNRGGNASSNFKRKEIKVKGSCNAFARGSCRYGDTCKYSHELQREVVRRYDANGVRIYENEYERERSRSRDRRMSPVRNNTMEPICEKSPALTEKSPVKERARSPIEERVRSPIVEKSISISPSTTPLREEHSLVNVNEEVSRERSNEKSRLREREMSIERSPVVNKERERSPIRRERSPIRRERSPVRRERSPVRRDRERGRSPIRNEMIREKSPVRKERSPVQREKSPVRKERSSTRRERSPLRKERSPLRKERSPLRKERSPLRKEWSPLRKERSRERSPVRKERSPVRERRLVDENLRRKNDDPRDSRDGRVVIKKRGNGRNTESFDPSSSFVRPDMRVIVGPKREVFGKTLKHDDVIIVPEFFCEENNWSLYYKLVEEVRGLQEKGVKDSQWVSWHEGSHLITKNPSQSSTFQMIQKKIANYFGIEMKSIGTRFNWYRDSKDWKPFHHDSAAFNPQRAKNQNITVGVSFGATRELAFLHATNKTKAYFPQTNGMLFSFGRDANITWKHGVNALPEEEQDGKGRISIVLWGLVKDVKEEENSPPMLQDNSGGYGHSMHISNNSLKNNNNNNDNNSNYNNSNSNNNFANNKDSDNHQSYHSNHNYNHNYKDNNTQSNRIHSNRDNYHNNHNHYNNNNNRNENR